MSKITSEKINQIKAVDFGNIEDLYPEHECTDAKRAAWKSSQDNWEAELEELVDLLSKDSGVFIGDILDLMSRIEMDWGADPATQSIVAILED